MKIGFPKLTFFQSNDDFTEVLEEFENIKNWDIIKDADNLESTKSKIGPFAMNPFSINDNFYLKKADWKLYGDCILNSCMTMVRSGEGEVVFKRDQQKQDCFSSCITQDPKKHYSVRNMIFAAGQYIRI